MLRPSDLAAARPHQRATDVLLNLKMRLTFGGRGGNVPGVAAGKPLWGEFPMPCGQAQLQPAFPMDLREVTHV